MPNTIEVVYADGDSAVCDGGGGALGHPKVYLAIDPTGRVTCPYCGRLFVRDPSRAGQVATIPQGEAAALASGVGSTLHR
jgi:uncharacterized Zn-finger protein